MTESHPKAATATGGGILIRQASADDADAIARLAGQLGYPCDRETALERLLALPQRDVVLVAEEAGSVVGWVHVADARSLLIEPHVLIQGLVVDEGCRGRGVGAALMHAAERRARDQGVRLVRLRSQTAREEAHRFYERLGYRRTKVQQVFVREV